MSEIRPWSQLVEMLMQLLWGTGSSSKRVTMWATPLSGINPGDFTGTQPRQHEYANAHCPVIHNQVEGPKHPPANESVNCSPSHGLLLSLKKEQSPAAACTVDKPCSVLSERTRCRQHGLYDPLTVKPLQQTQGGQS